MSFGSQVFHRVLSTYKRSQFLSNFTRSPSFRRRSSLAKAAFDLEAMNEFMGFIVSKGRPRPFSPTHFVMPHVLGGLKL